MKMRFINLLALLVSVASCGCYALETGNLTVIFSDTDGKPITNATVKVRTSKGAIWGRGSESEYFHYEGHSDSNGVASIDFGFRDADFDWDVETPSHYSDAFLSRRECFDSVVEESDYMNIDTNTVEGLARYEEMKKLYYADDAESYIKYLEKLQPKSVKYTNKRIVRSVRFYPKKNPRPMYGHMYVKDTPLPNKVVSSSVGNGMCVESYMPVDFDMKMRGFLSPWGDTVGNIGRVSDFRVVAFHVSTNNVETYYGWLEFAPGCGAYKMHKTGDESFPTKYEADTNAVFLSRIPFEYHNVGGTYTASKKLLDRDEYMILRTRSMCDDSGSVTNCNYSIVEGPMSARRFLRFGFIVFNPCPNDPNLEYDREHYLN